MKNPLIHVRAGFKPAPTLLTAALGLAMALTFSCSSDNDDGGGSSDGGSLKGTSWERRVTMYQYDVTSTITFTSDDRLTIKEVGWSETETPHYNGSTVTYTKTRTNINRTYDGTYTYYSNIKEGHINSNYWNTNLWNFKILSDNRTMAGKLDTWEFRKK